MDCSPHSLLFEIYIRELLLVLAIRSYEELCPVRCPDKTLTHWGSNHCCNHWGSNHCWSLLNENRRCWFTTWRQWGMREWGRQQANHCVVHCTSCARLHGAWIDRWKMKTTIANDNSHYSSRKRGEALRMRSSPGSFHTTFAFHHVQYLRVPTLYLAGSFHWYNFLMFPKFP